MRFEFAQEKFRDCYQEMVPLLEKNWAEVSHYLDIPLDVNVQGYQMLDESNRLCLFTAREPGTKHLIGYCVFFVNRNIHYNGSLQATQDVIYIDPKRRGFGMQFIKACDFALKNIGVQVVYQHVKVKHNWGKVLERIGYEHVEHIYARRLDKE